MRTLWNAISCVVLVAGVASGDIVIQLPSDPAPFQLLANTPGQLIPVLISTNGSDTISAFNFRAEIGGGTTGPIFEDFSFAGSILATASFLSENFPRVAGTNKERTGEAGAFDPTAVAASGTLGTLIVDTSGVTSGTYPLTFVNHVTAGLADSNLGASTIPTTFKNGSISVVPEPSAFLLVGFLACGMAGCFGVRRFAWPVLMRTRVETT